MTPEQVALVEQSHRHIGSVLGTVALEVHEHLMSSDPTVGALFATRRPDLARLVADELTALVGDLRDMDRFRPRAAVLGARHRGYGVRARHHRLFIESLLDALAARLGSGWRPEVAEAWRLALSLVSEAMLAGAVHGEAGGPAAGPARPEE